MEEERYEAVRYAADGHAGERMLSDPAMSDGAILCTGTLDECRAAIGRRHPFVPSRDGDGYSGRALAAYRWSGVGDDVEAYHEDDTEGCGGWAIRRVAAE
jgi:hypothetical protein